MREVGVAWGVLCLAAGCSCGPEAAVVDANRPSLRAACPDALLLGTAGAVSVDRVRDSLRWQDGWALGEPVTVAVPPDLTGLTIAVLPTDAAHIETGVAKVTLGERVLLDVARDDPELSARVGPFFHVPVPAGAVAFPMDPNSALSEGCLTVVPAALADVASVEVVFVSRRRPPGGRIDINAVVVGDTQIAEPDLEAAFAAAGAVYASVGDVRIGDVHHHRLAAPSPFVSDRDEAIASLRARFRGTDETRLNVYFVQDFLQPGMLGHASAIPGPNGVHGTLGSGLVISVDSHLAAAGTLDVARLGETLAHEIGHQMGLFHTSESDGDEHDGLPDTAECDGSHDLDDNGVLSARECRSAGGDNIMFWTSGDMAQTTLSPSQLAVLRASVAVQ